MIDIGNLHVIDYYLHLASQCIEPAAWNYWCTKAEDFDISTEQREGWAYEND